MDMFVFNWFMWTVNFSLLIDYDLLSQLVRFSDSKYLYIHV